MSTWRAKALELFPEYRQRILATDDRMDLWRDIDRELHAALRREDHDMTGRCLRYAIWTLHPTPQARTLGELSASAALACCGVFYGVGITMSGLAVKPSNISVMEPIWSKPWEQTYVTEDWWSDGRRPPEMPQLLIPSSVHRKGRKPKVEFEQVDPKYGIGDLKYTYVGEPDRFGQMWRRQP